MFDPPFDSETVIFNNYDLGEHWFGVKIKYSNPQQHQFLTLHLQVNRDSKDYAYSFLLPLFSLPLSGVEVSPENSFRHCH